MNEVIFKNLIDMLKFSDLDVCCGNYLEIVPVLDSCLFNNCMGNILIERYKQMIELRNDSSDIWRSSCNVLNGKDVLLSISQI